MYTVQTKSVQYIKVIFPGISSGSVKIYLSIYIVHMSIAIYLFISFFSFFIQPCCKPKSARSVNTFGINCILYKNTIHFQLFACDGVWLIRAASIAKTPVCMKSLESKLRFNLTLRFSMSHNRFQSNMFAKKLWRKSPKDKTEQLCFSPFSLPVICKKSLSLSQPGRKADTSLQFADNNFLFFLWLHF